MKYGDLKNAHDELQTEVGVLQYHNELLRREIELEKKKRILPSLFQQYADFDMNDVYMTPGYLAAVEFLLKNRQDIKRKFTSDELRAFKNKYWTVRKIVNNLSEFKRIKILSAKNHTPVNAY